MCVSYSFSHVVQRHSDVPSDAAIIKLRQLLLQALRDHEEGKALPFKWALIKAQGMKNEQVRARPCALKGSRRGVGAPVAHPPRALCPRSLQVIQEVFCWSRNPVEVRRLAARKEDLLAELLGDRRPMVAAGAVELLDLLQRSGAPVALISSAPERRVLPVLEEAGLASRFDVVVTGDDVYRGRPDPEGYLYAAQRIGRPPLRCVVLGSSNLSVEASHEVGMQCVAVAGTHPVYELTAADLVVRSLSDLSFVNLKSLFANEEGVLPHGEDDLEAEVEEDGFGSSQTAVQVMERW
jgi:HAD superfamily hydrolase (TIGR01509 family)